MLPYIMVQVKQSSGSVIFFSLSIDFTQHLHLDTWQPVTFTLLYYFMSFYYGQILIKTETDSYGMKICVNCFDQNELCEYTVNSSLIA